MSGAAVSTLRRKIVRALSRRTKFVNKIDYRYMDPCLVIYKGRPGFISVPSRFQTPDEENLPPAALRQSDAPS